MFIKFSFNVTKHLSSNKLRVYNGVLKNFRCYCSPVKRYDESKPGQCFEEMVRERRSEARRSFVIQVFSEQSCWDLFDYCSALSPVRFMQHYSVNNTAHFVLGELAKDELDHFLSSCRHIEDCEALPVKAPFLWFKTSQEKNYKRSKRSDPFPSFKPICEAELVEMVSHDIPISEQMKIIYEATKLTEIGIRLRFLTARQIELALSGLFPHCSVLPFGSSVNGFGKFDCDLDLGLRYSTVKTNSNDSRLVFQCKELSQNGRAQIQRQMEILADVLHIFLPGCTNVRRILRARVPIVKYNHDYTGVECDLSMTDLTGVYMSELLWLFGSIDSRVRPLVFTVRRWAQCVGLTSTIPGKSITNFTLTTLVIFYLQTLKILPTYLDLIKLARPQDVRYAGDVNCTFIRDYSKISRNDNQTDMGALLTGFYEFYSTYDYESYGICIRVGKPVSKPDHSPLYLVNPLEYSLNVSRNVSLEELTRLKVECRNASWVLQSTSSLLNIFKPLQSSNHKTTTKAGKRLVTVKHLFKKQDIS